MTLGGKRVGINFNNTDNDNIKKIKTLSAELINLLETYKTGEFEKDRVVEQAQMNVEIASMLGVKAQFIK